MAHMIPKDPPPVHAAGGMSERDVFFELERQLGEAFFVYSRLSYIDEERLTQGEADFLVLHPELGMLVIECKGTGVLRDGKGVWYRKRRDGTRKPLRESPFEQAKRTQYDLVDKLEPRLQKALPKRDRFPMVYGHAVAFPRAEANELNLPLDHPRGLIFDASDMESLGDKVVAAMQFWKDKTGRAAPEPLEPWELKRVRKQGIHPVLEIVETLESNLKADSRALLRLTKQQLETVRGFGRNQRLRVVGGAGTGKTVLALEAARRNALEGKEVLLVCYNSRLGDFLRSSVKDIDLEGSGGRIHATTFFKLCAYAHHELHDGKGLPVPADKKEQDRFWAEEAPYFLLQGIEEGPLEKYDCIVVDEGQDFAATWWEVLGESLKDKAEGKTLVFYDPSQEIFGRGCHVPEWPTFELTYNFRNTRRIADTVKKLGRVEMISYETCPEGEDPKVEEQRSAAKMQRRLSELVSELTTKGSVPIESITVLTPHTQKNSSLKGVHEVAGFELCDTPFDREGCLLHTSIGAFKGLESDILILLDIDPKDPRCDMNARYVAASRAKHRLFVFSKGDWVRES